MCSLWYNRYTSIKLFYFLISLSAIYLYSFWSPPFRTKTLYLSHKACIICPLQPFLASPPQSLLHLYTLHLRSGLKTYTSAAANDANESTWCIGTVMSLTHLKEILDAWLQMIVHREMHQLSNILRQVRSLNIHVPPADIKMWAN